MIQGVDLRNYFFYIACTIVLLAGIKVASEIVIILFLAIFISSIFSTVLTLLQNKGFPRFIAYVVVLSIFLCITIFTVYIINLSLQDFLSNLDNYEEKLNKLIISTIALASQYGYEIDKNAIFDTLNIGSFFGVTTTLIGSIGTFLSKFLLVIIGVAFILAETKSSQTKLKMLFGKNQKSFEHFELFSHNIKKYFIVKSFTSLLTGAVIGFMLILFGVDYPILWGFIAVLFNFVPVIGSLVAAIPAILLSLIELDMQTTIYIMVLYFIINISISNIIEPKLMGKELGLSPLVIFFSLILWGWLLGIVGMFLAVPITMTLKIAFNSNHQTKWIALLMSDISKQKKKIHT